MGQLLAIFSGALLGFGIIYFGVSQNSFFGMSHNYGIAATALGVGGFVYISTQFKK